MIWWRWLTDNLVGANTVVVNMDETSVQHEYSAKKGFVCNLATEAVNSAHGFFLPMKEPATRSHTTLVAMVTPDAEMQPYLPQILIPNHDRTSKAEYTHYAQLGQPILVWKNCTGWVDTGLMCDILTQLRRCVRDQRGAGCQIVLLLDSASQHVSGKVLRHAAQLRIILVLVPAQCTWLLQPLDVEVFLHFKEDLRKRQTLERLEAEDAIINAPARIRILGETIRKILVEANHAKAFARTGLASAAQNVAMRRSIQRYMPPPEAIESRALTKAELEILVGRRRVVEIHAKFFRRPERVIQELQALAAEGHAAPPAQQNADAEVNSGELHVSQRLPPSPPPMPPPGSAPASQVPSSPAQSDGPIAHHTRAQMRARRQAEQASQQH